METVYVLELENSCWYVGKTTNLESRLAAHARGEGSEWTRLNPPVKPVHAHAFFRVPTAAAAGEETRQTAKLMLAKGVNQVRGAELAEPRKYDAGDAERIVGLIGHHLGMNYDDVRELVEGQLSEESSSDKEDESSSSGSYVEPDECLNCGQRGHWARECPMRGKQDGQGGGGLAAWAGVATSAAAARAGRPCACYTCGARDHWAPNCPMRCHGGGGGGGGAAAAAAAGACFRCGNTSHFSRDCFARWHVNGYSLD